MSIHRTLRPLLASMALCLVSTQASAFYGADMNVSVIDTIAQTGAATWQYNYTVSNNTTCIGNCGDTVLGVPVMDMLALNSFAVPYFADAGISNISAPADWSWSIDVNDLFALGSGAGALVWTALNNGAAIPVAGSQGGFTYTASFGPGKGPFQATLRNGSFEIGDPAIPLSPTAIAAGIQPLGGQPPSAVPLPASMWLMLSGLGMLAAFRRRNPSQPV